MRCLLSRDPVCKRGRGLHLPPGRHGARILLPSGMHCHAKEPTIEGTAADAELGDVTWLRQGWVLSGEQWPGQIFSFVRSQRPTKQSSWRQIKARTCLDQTLNSILPCAPPPALVCSLTHATAHLSSPNWGWHMRHKLHSACTLSTLRFARRPSRAWMSAAASAALSTVWPPSSSSRPGCADSAPPS